MLLQVLCGISEAQTPEAWHRGRGIHMLPCEYLHLDYDIHELSIYDIIPVSSGRNGLGKSSQTVSYRDGTLYRYNYTYALT